MQQFMSEFRRQRRDGNQHLDANHAGVIKPRGRGIDRPHNDIPSWRFPDIPRGARNHRIRHCVESTSKQVGWLPRGQRGGAEGALAAWMVGMSAVGGGGCTVDPGRARREESSREIERVRKYARGSETPRRVELAATVHRRRAGDMATSQKALMDTRQSTNTHECTENGGPEKERIPFCRAGGDGER